MNTKINLIDKNSHRGRLARGRSLPVGTQRCAAFHALAILRGVRHASGDTPDLRETIALAREQGAAFQRWCESNTPIRRVQVRIDSHLVMTVTPELSSVRLNSFQFDVPSSGDAVLQILKADEGAEEVLLGIMPLSNVSSVGLDETMELPNGQRIRLVIRSQDECRYEIEVAFTAEEDTKAIESPERAQANRSAKVTRKLPDTFGHYREALAMFFPQFNHLGTLTCAFSLLLAFCLIAINNLPGNSLGDRVVAPARGDDNAEAVPLSLASEGRSPAHAADQGEVGIVEPPTYRLIPARRVIKTGLSPQLISHPQSARDWQRKDAEDTVASRVYTSWDSENLKSFASIRSVKVAVENTVGASTDLDTLRSSFVRVIESGEFWRVSEGRADAVLKLTLVSSWPGVVRAEMLDAENKVMWSAYVRGLDLQRREHGAVFVDASQRLVDKLLDTVTLSKNLETGLTTRNRANGLTASVSDKGESRACIY